jgi:DNA uptake protein ComE-like DNA-binding protein
MGRTETVVDAAGVNRTVRSVDAKEIAAIAAQSSVVEQEKVVNEPEVEEVADASAFPENFPGALALIRAEIGHHAALRMSKDELVAIKGIGEKLADEILKLRS